MSRVLRLVGVACMGILWVAFVGAVLGGLVA